MHIQAVRQTENGLVKTDLELVSSSTVQDALNACGWSVKENTGLSIFGVRCKPETTLEEGDRIELSLPLLVDPKEVRRLRAEQREREKSAPRGRRHAPR